VYFVIYYRRNILYSIDIVVVVVVDVDVAKTVANGTVCLCACVYVLFWGMCLSFPHSALLSERERER
jgi:hypothetical protein